MFSFFTKTIPPKVYFLIWLFNVIYFVILTILFNKFTSFFQKNPLMVSVFGPMYLGNILIGIIVFLFGIASLSPKKANEVPQDKGAVPKKTYLVLFFIMFIVTIFALIFSNIPFFTSDTMQFPRLVMLAFFAFISLVFFILYLSTYPQKIIKKNSKSKERHTISYWVGDFVISGVLAVLISILFGFISIPFMQVAEGLSFAEKAKIGGINMWRIVIMFGFLTIIISFFCFRKKLYRSLAGMLIFFWIAGTGIVIFINSSSNKTLLNFNVNSGSSNFLITRSSCNKDVTLQQVKGCVLRILRDDGGHGSGFIINPGYLITNKHVIEGAGKLSVYINGEKDIKVWNYSPNLDLAVLKLPDSSLTNTCNWFDSKQLSIAEELYTFGWPNNPTGDSTVTKGIYSRTNKYEDGTEDIQTDASINPGNSGGPLVNECGVVGINTARADWTQEQAPRVIEGMSFALSSNYIHTLIDELIKNGDIAKGIPNQATYQSNRNAPNNPSQNFTLDIENIKSYLNDVYRVKSSWEQARGHVNTEKLDRLIDSFNRQIEFCNHLINKLSGGQSASGDDINLWKAVLRMSDESATLTNELNGR